MLKEISGYIVCNQTNADIVRKLGFDFRADKVENKGFIILEGGHAWLVEEIKSNGRFKDREITLNELLLKVNSNVDLSKSFCEASVGVLSHLLSIGYMPTRNFSDKTKFFVFDSNNKTFSGVETASLNDKVLVTLTNGVFAPRKGNLSLKFIEDIANDIDFITYNELKETL